MIKILAITLDTERHASVSGSRAVACASYHQQHLHICNKHFKNPLSSTSWRWPYGSWFVSLTDDKLQWRHEYYRRIHIKIKSVSDFITRRAPSCSHTASKEYWLTCYVKKLPCNREQQLVVEYFIEDTR